MSLDFFGTRIGTMNLVHKAPLQALSLTLAPSDGARVRERACFLPSPAAVHKEVYGGMGRWPFAAHVPQ